ncbi:MAG: TraR/DksA family transcriptional regulator [Acidimicrobiales bacterium]|nr:TraR/DksA family transcriptional regulator [Acidimicrobiales bacterium]
MTPTEREALRQAVRDAQREVAARIEHLAHDHDAIVEASEMVALDDEHDPEGATVAFERAQVAALLRQARVDLTDLAAAHDRIDAGTYGICEGCGQPIVVERLLARPTSTTCVACAARRAHVPLGTT